jgi:predicted nuclease of predicted toxin-antitoxin system
VKFIVDAQLPKSLSDWLNENGFDSIHTLNLINRNATGDDIIRQITVAEQRILITKDTDFEDSFLLKKIPPKLILIATGNISNKNLIKPFSDNIDSILNKIKRFSFIEIDTQQITVHE